MSEWKPPAPFDAASRHAESARPPAALPDLLGLVAAVIGFFVFAGSVELSEKVVGWGSGYESWQLDEVPLSLLVLSIGLVWFAFRRVAEARREVAERVRAEARVAELLARNRELSQRLILTQENERRAMARELHDQIGQDCTAIRAEASYLIHAARGENEPVMASARRIAGISESLYAIVRDLLGRLRPPALDDTVGITVFRLVQEGLTNIARHSGADQVRIELRLQADGEQLLLSIADNGRGLPDADSPRPGFGLIGMAERVGGLHGTLRLISQPGQGLRIEARLPTTVAVA